MGWHLFRPAKFGKDVVWHNGGAGGYRSFVGFVKETQTGVVVLSNSDAEVDSVGMAVLGWLNPPCPSDREKTR